MQAPTSVLQPVSHRSMLKGLKANDRPPSLLKSAARPGASTFSAETSTVATSARRCLLLMKEVIHFFFSGAALEKVD